MVGIGAKDLQPVNDLRGRRLNGWVGGVAEDSNAAVKRVGASGPSVTPVLRKPAMSGFMVEVCGIEEGHEHIHVEQ